MCQLCPCESYLEYCDHLNEIKFVEANPEQTQSSLSTSVGKRDLLVGAVMQSRQLDRVMECLLYTSLCELEL